MFRMFRIVADNAFITSKTTETVAFRSRPFDAAFRWYSLPLVGSFIPFLAISKGALEAGRHFPDVTKSYDEGFKAGVENETEQQAMRQRGWR